MLKGADGPASASPAIKSTELIQSRRLSKIGEDVTETLDVVPRQWFVTEHVREKFSCRSCERITQPPARPSLNAWRMRTKKVFPAKI